MLHLGVDDVGDLGYKLAVAVAHLGYGVIGVVGEIAHKLILGGLLSGENAVDDVIEFFGVEGLGEIGIGAGFECFVAVVLGAFCRNHYNRYVAHYARITYVLT